MRAVRSLPARALRPAPNNSRREKENVSDHGHVVQKLVEREEVLDEADDRDRREELQEICDRRLTRRGGLKHLQWEGDCGLYSGSETEGEYSPPRLMLASTSNTSSPRSQVTAIPPPVRQPVSHSPPLPPPGPAYLASDGQTLVTAHSDRLLNVSYAHQERTRRISDPGPALVAEWLAGVRA